MLFAVSTVLLVVGGCGWPVPTEVPEGQAEPEDPVELCCHLYGRYGVLRLDDAQEDETAFSLLPPPEPSVREPAAGCTPGRCARVARRDAAVLTRPGGFRRRCPGTVPCSLAAKGREPQQEHDA